MDDQSTADGTPEDVAALYSWANLQGAKYRDYSASRREHRAQVRYKAAKAVLERELRAQMEAEAANAEAERVGEAAAGAASSNGGETPSAELSARDAAARRVEGARMSEAAARAAVLALREEREIAEAHSSARRQALMYEATELRRRELAGPQPYEMAGDLAASADAQAIGGDGLEATQPLLFSSWPDMSELVEAQAGEPAEADDEAESLEGDEPGAPAWLFSPQSGSHPPLLQTISQVFRRDALGTDTLQDSRERVAARWFALKGVFEDLPELPTTAAMWPAEGKAPVLAVFSLAGGVGKTSVVAALGRALAEQGEKVLLVDTTPHSVLPIYFGAREVYAGVTQTLGLGCERGVRTISLVAHDFAGREDDGRQRELLAEDILRSGLGHQRVLLDLSTGSSWLVRRFADLHPVVLVPVSPDMNSVVSLKGIERLFRGITDSGGRPLLPFYILNQFDSSLPLHLDVREVFRRQLGDRLLRLSVRQSPAVSEALAEGMTVLDYAPEALVAQDYRDVALWLRGVSPPAAEAFGGPHWSER